MTDENALAEARQHGTALKGFHVHLIIFVCVISGPVGINLATKSGWWVQWPLLDWGEGIVGHAIGVFSPVSGFGHEWEERKIQEHLAKINGSRSAKTTSPSTNPRRGDPRRKWADNQT